MVALSQEYLDSTRQELIDNTGETSEFNRVAQDFLSRGGLRLSETPGDHTTATFSSITNERTYDLDTTTLAQYKADRKKSLAAQQIWEDLGIEGRRKFFEIMFTKVLPQYREQFALAIALDTGKTISDARGEFDKGLEYYGWAASKQVARELSPKMLVTDQLGRKFARTDSGQYIIREVDGSTSVHDDIPEDVTQLHFQVIPSPDPLKIIGSMAPSNYAWALEAADEAARIAGGVLQSKPPSKAPSVIHMLVEAEKEGLDILADELGLDAEKLQTLKEGLHTIITGRDVAQTWFKEVDVLRAVTSKENGEEFDQTRTEAGFLPIHTALEKGGNNAVTILSSYEDPAAAAEATTRESWKNTGERCTSPRRLFIDKKCFPECEARLRQVHAEVWADPIKAGVGHPLADDTKYGPLLNKGAYEKLQRFLEAAREAGAEVIGGERITSKDYQGHDYLDKGYYTIPPTVFWHSEEQKLSLSEDIKQLMHDKEIFAHLLNVDAVDSAEHAAEKTCRSTEHLSSGLYGSLEDFNTYSDKLREKDAHPGSLYHNGQPKDGAPILVHSGSQDGGRGDTGGFQSFVHYTTANPGGSDGTVIYKDRKNFTQRFEEEAAKGTQFALG